MEGEGESGPGVGEVIVSEAHIRERDGVAPRGPGDRVELVTHGKTLRTRVYGNHKQDYTSNHGTVVKVSERRDPRTGDTIRMFHIKPE